MYKRKNIVLAIIVMFAGGLVIFFCNAIKTINSDNYFIYKLNKKETKVYMKYSPEIQATERIIEKITPDLISEINNDTSKIIMPAKFSFDKNGNLYVLDCKVPNVKKLDPKGKYLKEFGKKGDGPGELRQSVIFSVMGVDSLYVYDSQKYMIVCYEKGNTRNININSGILDIIVSKNNNFTTLGNGYNQYSQIVEYDFLGNALLNYESLIDFNGSKMSYITGDLLDGKILKYKNNVIYVPKYFNHIVFYNDGKIIKAVTTLDERQNPEIETTSMEDGGRAIYETGSLTRSNNLCNYRAYLIGDEIYIFSIPGSKKYKGKLFDIYNAENGKYIKSILFNVPFGTSEIAITKDMLVLLDANLNIHIYNYFYKNK